MLKGVPFQCPGFAVVGIILLDETVAPHLNGLDEVDSKHRGRRDDDGYFRVLASSGSYLHVDGLGRQQPGKVVWRMVETLRARVHHNHLVAGTRVHMIPVKRPRGTLQFSASAQSRRQANDFLYRLYPGIRCVPTPRINSVEQGHAALPGKLLRCIAPGLEQSIG